MGSMLGGVAKMLPAILGGAALGGGGANAGGSSSGGLLGGLGSMVSGVVKPLWDMLGLGSSSNNAGGGGGGSGLNSQAQNLMGQGANWMQQQVGSGLNYLGNRAQQYAGQYLPTSMQPMANQMIGQGQQYLGNMANQGMSAMQPYMNQFAPYANQGMQMMAPYMPQNQQMMYPPPMMPMYR